MSKYEKQGQTKIVNSYGGVGTLIQTMKNGSLIIDNFDNWPYYEYLRRITRNNTDQTGLSNQAYFINEPRLVKKLSEELNCQNLASIFRMPENEMNWDNNQLVIQNASKVVSARFFPESFYCPSCGKLANYRSFISNTNPDYPFCCGIACEQFSFVLVSASGEITDIPWIEFLLAEYNQNQINFEKNSEDNRQIELKFSTGNSAEHLASKSVEATINNQEYKKSLVRLPQIVFKDEKGNDYQMQIRQGNNITFVQTISSVFIPKYVIPINEVQLINGLKINNHSNDQILTTIRTVFPNTQTTIYHINALDNDAGEYEDQYKWEEYDFIVNNQDEFDSDNLKFKRFPFSQFGIKNLYRVNRLKVTHVQTSYKRLNPETGDEKRIFTDPNIQFYPGVEMFGEGMMIEMNLDTLQGYLLQNPQLNEDQLYAIIHSFSHGIMKELEFVCGYPLNSLKERLYIESYQDNNGINIEYAGFLIYSATSAESSFGGIAELFDGNVNNRKINVILNNTVERAKDCPNDPICIDEVRSGNVGACYSCNLVPEISCENFNASLNRKLFNAFMETL